MVEEARKLSLEFNNNAESSFSVHPDLPGFVKDALNAGDQERVKNLVRNLHHADLAELLELLSVDEREQLVKVIKKDFSPEVLVDLDHGIKEEILNLLGFKKTADAITQLETGEAAEVISELGEKRQEKILRSLPEEKREIVEETLSFSEDSVGRFMDRRFISVPEDWTVRDVTEFLQGTSEIPDDIYYVYVLNHRSEPLGYFHIGKLIKSKPNVPVSEIMDTNIKIISVDMDKEEAAYVFQKYSLLSAPVVDYNGKIIGRMSVDDVVSIIRKKAEEDIMHLGGVSVVDFHLPVRKTAHRRFNWLLINLFTAIAASAIVAYFENSIARLVTLAVLAPIIASMSGNAGIQTLTVAITAIANKELSAVNAARVIMKEVYVSLINGMLFALIVGATSWALYQNLHLSIIFGLAMIISLVAAALSGALIPMLLAKVGVDPATASGVILTTVTDMVSFFVFLGLASLMIS